MITGMMARRITAAELIGIDPLQTASALTLSESNRRYKMTGGVNGLWNCANCNNPKSSGKRVFEIEITDSGYNCVGVVASSLGSLTNQTAPTNSVTTGSAAVWNSVRLYYHSSSYITASLSANTVGSVLRMYCDLDTGEVWVARNGVLFGGNPETGTSPTYTMTVLGEKEVRVGTYQSNSGARVALTADQLSSDPIPSGWQPWA